MKHPTKKKLTVNSSTANNLTTKNLTVKCYREKVWLPKLQVSDNKAFRLKDATAKVLILNKSPEKVDIKSSNSNSLKQKLRHYKVYRQQFYRFNLKKKKIPTVKSPRKKGTKLCDWFKTYFMLIWRNKNEFMWCA